MPARRDKVRHEGAPQREDPLVNFSLGVDEQADSLLDSRETHGNQDISSSDTGSSSSSSSSGSAKEQNDPIVAPRIWDPDVTMYRNIKSKVVLHIVAVGGANSFSCGIRISSDYEQIEASAFLELRKCKRCALAKPIKTVGQFASALKKLRTESRQGHLHRDRPRFPLHSGVMKKV